MKVWKFELPVEDDEFTLEMPADARLLSVGVQGARTGPTPVMWALVSPDAPRTRRRFRLVDTGDSLDPTGMTFVGTFQMMLSRGEYVGHVWENHGDLGAVIDDMLQRPGQARMS